LFMPNVNDSSISPIFVQIIKTYSHFSCLWRILFYKFCLSELYNLLIGSDVNQFNNYEDPQQIVLVIFALLALSYLRIRNYLFIYFPNA